MSQNTTLYLCLFILFISIQLWYYWSTLWKISTSFSHVR